MACLPGRTLSMQGVLQETAALLSRTAVAPAGSVVTSTSCGPLAGRAFTLGSCSSDAASSALPSVSAGSCVFSSLFFAVAVCVGLGPGFTGAAAIGVSIGLGFLSSTGDATGGFEAGATFAGGFGAAGAGG